MAISTAAFVCGPAGPVLEIRALYSAERYQELTMMGRPNSLRSRSIRLKNSGTTRSSPVPWHAIRLSRRGWKYVHGQGSNAASASATDLKWGTA